MHFLFALGVVNISALNHIISWQKLQYDFSYYKKDFATNVVSSLVNLSFILYNIDTYKLLSFFRVLN